MNKAGGVDVCYEGLVPCGKPLKRGTPNAEGKCTGAPFPNPADPREEFPCKFCHFFVMLKAIVIDFLLITVAPILAVIAIVVNGVQLYFAMGNPAELKRVTNNIFQILLILALVFGAWIIVNTVFCNKIDIIIYHPCLKIIPIDIELIH